MKKEFMLGGQKREVLLPELTDEQAASSVRMLLRSDLNHEMVCTLGRDRILYLSQKVAELERCLGLIQAESRRVIQPGKPDERLFQIDRFTQLALHDPVPAPTENQKITKVQCVAWHNDAPDQVAFPVVAEIIEYHDVTLKQARSRFRTHLESRFHGKLRVRFDSMPGNVQLSTGDWKI